MPLCLAVLILAHLSHASPAPPGDQAISVRSAGVPEAVETTKMQTVRVFGRVTDADGHPVQGATIDLPGAAISAVSSAYGRFELRTVPVGNQVLRTRMLGYATRRDTVHFPAAGTFDLAIQLVPEPIDLPPITVEARSRWLAAQGFYERRRESGLSGHVVTRADIERKKPTRLQDLLQDIPGIRIYPFGAGKTSIRFNRYVSLRANDPLDGCEPLIWLDGQRYIEKMSIRSAHGDVSHVEDVNFISPEVIEAIEVYVGIPPIRFNHPCGVILIWTRRGG